MKFLVDRCAGRRLADWLRSEGHDVVESRERGPDPGDRTLLEWAAGEGRVLVTIDTDFGALVFVEGLSHCGVVRLPDVVADTRIALMRQVLARHGQEVETGAIITVRGGRIRISRTPG
jgi:predicted nuclease of predicted toxin-antitoxin system